MKNFNTNKPFVEVCSITGLMDDVCVCEQCFPELHASLEDWITVDHLIALLQYIDMVGKDIPTYECDGDMLLQHDYKLVDTISGIACGVLIGDDGSCNWTNIRKVEEAGYRVYAGEKDSFGWLTGCIRTSVGVVVYG